ncbi:DUF4214 domain-containing protein [Roseicella aquatilis]|uniref:DUF4214 domain-containing protein n=1 Tax=Roseicella aquatilis TaxID=2527868 RepID=A0A4R4DQC8_9PROT|nr:DUF4214 domain-containing protein [Roseicella aquatilis]TCZ63018.1 DUF4214 domain-containing protein [Roseicella aquatilis]
MARSLIVSGVLPASLAENSGPDDWTATLNLSGSLTGLVGVELLGRDALDFRAELLPGFNAVRITPGAPVDYEALVAAKRAPVLTFSLRFTYADGGVVEDRTTRQVAVLDRDDAPPTALAFTSGGTVVAGAIGAAIGTLSVTDLDSTGPYIFTFAEEDAWRFEVVDSVLRLRSGISLGLDDMPGRPVIIQVSDGTQSAAFTLTIKVANPSTSLSDLPAGETREGFALAAPDRVVAMQESRAVAQADVLGAGGRLVTMQDGGQVVLPAAERVQFVDGFQDIGAESPGVRAAALVHALSGHDADAALLATLVAKAEAGLAWTDIAAGFPALSGSHAAAVTTLYHNALGRDPTTAELASQAGRLAGGLSRAQLVVDVALGDEALAHQPEGGVWVADALGTDAAWRGGAGGLGEGTVTAPAVTDLPWLM